MSFVRRSWRYLGFSVIAIFVVLSLAFVALSLALRGSLPAIEGEISIAGLKAPVSIERDLHGRPRITAGNWSDLARTLGYLHAQERFFQMDMARRAAAGELAELLGEGPVPLDKSRRRHRLRDLAVARLKTLEPSERRLIESYTAGVNAGLAQLRARPFEYLLLNAHPREWQPEDLLLVVYAMFFQLTDELASRDGMLTALRDVYPAPYFAFLTQDGTPWDAPVVGEARSPLPVPGADVYTLPPAQPEKTASVADRSEQGHDMVPGSNNWALHGSRTESGVAILANDMHLGHGLPNVWYQARLVIRGSADDVPAIDVTGVTLPGTFGVIVGSNRNVAWGFTNSYGDWSDLVIIEVDPEDASRYRVGDGYEAFTTYEQSIPVKGGDAEPVSFQWTRWGPVIGEDHEGRLLALKWLAHEPEAVNSGIIDLAGAKDVVSALEIANGIGAPPQNFVVADRKGNIGWTILGRVPRRAGYDSRYASSWADPGVGWQGWYEAREYPRIFNPPGGQIWTANARVVDAEGLRFLGDGGYDLGARAAQIRDSLTAMESANEADMLWLQLDDRALFLERWQKLLLELLDDESLEGQPGRSELRAAIADWHPRASVDSAGFRLVRAWRVFLFDEVFEELTTEAREAAPSTSIYSSQWEGALWTLLEQQPAHLLPTRYESWRDWMLDVVDDTVDYYQERYSGGLADRVWGERNRVRVAHPLSQFVPGLGQLVNMPALALPGDNNMPRVQAPGFGASQRLGVSPGREEEGYLHMPGGQSGHPLSPYYGSQHNSWAKGEPLSFLPGPPRYQLRLVPAP
ncbi:MAG: penicillin acylase family protein [Gammaproteobacteria bacterium]|nr:penicillin acylase family protein [Gammaproteobacteria bacterium]